MNIKTIFLKSGGAEAELVISLSVEEGIGGDSAMTLTARKRFVAGGVVLLVCLANAGMFVNWLEAIGLIGWAQHFCDRYLTGTAITVIATLLILLPSGAVVAICAQRCRVCDALLLRRGKYCNECGSRV